MLYSNSFLFEIKRGKFGLDFEDKMDMSDGGHLS